MKKEIEYFSKGLSWKILNSLSSNQLLSAKQIMPTN
jgi:hypothetical protein